MILHCNKSTFVTTEVLLHLYNKAKMSLSNINYTSKSQGHLNRFVCENLLYEHYVKQIHEVQGEKESLDYQAWLSV